MTLLTLTFLHVPRTAALEARVRESVQRLERINDRIAQCHLTVEGTGARADGAPADENARYAVRIELSVPGARIHADNLQQGDAPQHDVLSALREAFDNAKRQLQSLRWDH
jgi:ribosome-associated translation inhibitor RaiA